MAKRQKQLLFVCTGNICRSPMAEYLLRDRLGPRATWRVSSSGTAALPGYSASDEAVHTLRARNLDLRPHRSRIITRQQVDAATVIVVMTRAHRDQIERLFPDVRDKLYLLKTFDPQAAEPDLEDPIGMPLHVYGEACEEVEKALPGLIRYMDTFRGPDKAS